MRWRRLLRRRSPPGQAAPAEGSCVACGSPLSRGRDPATLRRAERGLATCVAPVSNLGLYALREPPDQRGRVTLVRVESEAESTRAKRACAGGAGSAQHGGGRIRTSVG